MKIHEKDSKLIANVFRKKLKIKVFSKEIILKIMKMQWQFYEKINENLRKNGNFTKNEIITKNLLKSWKLQKNERKWHSVKIFIINNFNSNFLIFRQNRKNSDSWKALSQIQVH